MAAPPNALPDPAEVRRQLRTHVVLHITPGLAARVDEPELHIDAYVDGQSMWVGFGEMLRHLAVPVAQDVERHLNDAVQPLRAVAVPNPAVVAGGNVYGDRVGGVNLHPLGVQVPDLPPREIRFTPLLDDQVRCETCHEELPGADAAVHARRHAPPQVIDLHEAPPPGWRLGPDVPGQDRLYECARCPPGTTFIRPGAPEFAEHDRMHREAVEEAPPALPAPEAAPPAPPEAPGAA